jgi:TolB protein
VRSQLRQLTSRIGIETQADWSKDGARIVFVSDRSGSAQVYLLDLETNEDLRLTFDGIYNADPRFSPDGRLILFTKRVDGKDQIHIMDVNGENVRAITRGRFNSEQAEWSPDGHQLAFTSDRTGDYKLYVVSTDGSNLRRLTETPAGFDESSPSWTRRRLFR